MLSIQVGDTIEILCHNPNNPSFHNPFVIHRDSVGVRANASEGMAIWAVSALFHQRDGEKGTDFWAALRPCPTLPDVKPKDGFCGYNTRHYVGHSICFAKVGLYVRPVTVIQDFHSRIESLPITTGSIFFQ